jgi:alkylhydroperoxidase family enzyme
MAPAPRSTDDPVMRLTIHTSESAPVKSRPVLDGIHTDLGLVPNLAASAAESPALLQGFDGLRRAVAGIDPIDREVAGLSTGVAVDNHYGVAFHSTVLARLGVAEEDITAMRAGSAPADERQAAVYGFARECVTHRGKVSDATLDRLTATGATAADVLDIVAECMFASLVGVVDNLAGRVDLDPFLRPRAWQPE